MDIIFPDTTDIIDKIRSVIGRNVVFIYTISSEPCPFCNLDPITNTSTDSFCTTCSGKYWIPVTNRTTVSAHITWGHSEDLNWVTGGQYFEGDCRIQIKLTDENITLANLADSVEVDGKLMTIKKKILRGAQNLNRILLDLVEKEDKI
jgi:hypothetical protein